MVWCERGIQVLLTTVGAFAAFALMTVAIGTDYWLYARAFICNSTANSSQDDPHNKDKKDPGALTHSGLWRICCLEGKWTSVFVCGGGGTGHVHKGVGNDAWRRSPPVQFLQMIHTHLIQKQIGMCGFWLFLKYENKSDARNTDTDHVNYTKVLFLTDLYNYI